MTWTRETLRAELIQLFQGHAIGEIEVKETSHLVADLSFDSLGVMEVVADIEDRFGLQFPDNDLREVDTVADVARALEVKLQGDGRLSG